MCVCVCVCVHLLTWLMRRIADLEYQLHEDQAFNENICQQLEQQKEVSASNQGGGPSNQGVGPSNQGVALLSCNCVCRYLRRS